MSSSKNVAKADEILGTVGYVVAEGVARRWRSCRSTNASGSPHSKKIHCALSVRVVFPLRFGVLFFICVSSLACGGPPPPASVDALQFPVLVLFEQSGVVSHDDAADLRTMSVQRVVGSNSPPFLIDSRLDTYRLEKLASVHGGMWLLANPSGTTKVTFELMRVAQADAAQARRLIAERDGGLRNDPDPAKLAALERAGTLAEMLSVVGR